MHMYMLHMKRRWWTTLFITTLFPFHYIIFCESYSLDVVWSVVEFHVFVWLEAVVVLTAAVFLCLNPTKDTISKEQRKRETLIAVFHIGDPEHRRCVMLSEGGAVKLILLFVIFQNEQPEWWLRIDAFILIPCCCNTGREERVVLERTWSMQKNDAPVNVA